MIMKKSNIYIFFTFILLILFSCNSDNIVKTPHVEKGFLDLTDWDFEKNGSVKLNGEWEFYWNKFLNSSDTIVNEPDSIKVPGNWYGTICGKDTVGSYGFATYRVVVKVDDLSERYAL